MARAAREHEYKSFPAVVTKVDADRGIVDAVVAVFGNLDAGDDVIWPGAFAKTLSERGRKVRVLDAHNSDSILRVIGMPVGIRELARHELPGEILSRHPDATGGLSTQTQFLLDTPEGSGAFARIKAGALDEWSIGYDTILHDYSKRSDGKMQRNLRELRLWEYSPVLWGMNPATVTLSAKGDGEEAAVSVPVETTTTATATTTTTTDGPAAVPSEPPPADHAPETDAGDTPASAPSDGPEAKEMVAHASPQQRLGDVLQGTIHREFSRLSDAWYIDGFLSRDERIALSSLIGSALDVLASGMPADLAAREIWCHGGYTLDSGYMSAGAPDKTKDVDPAAVAVWMGQRLLFTVPDAEKAGRVLSRASAQRVQNALSEITELLRSAGLLENGDDEEKTDEPVDESDPVVPLEEKTVEAGPLPAPTSEQQLLAVQRGLAELALMEVYP